MLGKLLGLAAVGSAFAGIPPLHRILSSILILLFLMAVTAFMLCAVVVGGFVILYFCMLHHGVDAYTAEMILGFAACLVAGTLAALTWARLQRLQGLLSPNILKRASGVSGISTLAFAFIDGFLNPEK
jgi:peptidoglycan/LPS O-acetylase OafA/YrhL